jgi:prefoldin subunit 4
MMVPTKEDHEDEVGNDVQSPASAPSVMIWHGETFFESNEDEATAFCEARIETLQKQLDALKQEQVEIDTQQAELKRLLYGRFGKSINLEAE